MGSYDISVNRAIDVSFINCTQTNSIDDNTYWGIFLRYITTDSGKTLRISDNMYVFKDINVMIN